jgi:3',5'-cyclic AMP phosphodiesterase CpdA
VAVGDIGWCGSSGVGLTARLLNHTTGDLLLLGDLAYMDGLIEEFRRCFDPDYGRYRSRFRPVAGNHEYNRADADGYFTYFGDQAGPSRRGYYSFRAGTWLVLMLNSSLPLDAGSAQYAWAKSELLRDPTRCAMAALHHPYDSSGPNGPTPNQRDLWQLLYDQNADVVLGGHDHFYERFAPQDHQLRADPNRGIRLFTVGTGGAPLYDRARGAANSELLIKSYGALRMKLEPSLYEWEFLDANSGAATDRGLTICH